MPHRGTKRKSPENPLEPAVPDPMIFADQFCDRHRIVASNQVGMSEVEKNCHRQADAAREEYKNFRDDELERITEENVEVVSDSPTTTVQQPRLAKAAASPADNPLTPAQKYSRRLFNNRKSAAASRVHAEVLRRAQSTALQRSDETVNTTSLELQIKELEGQCESWMVQVENLKHQLENEQRKTADLEVLIRRDRGSIMSMPRHYQELKFLLEKFHYEQGLKDPSQLVPKSEDFNRLLDEHQNPLALSSQEYDIVNQLPCTSGLPIGSTTQQSFGASQQSVEHPDYLNDSQPHFSQSDSQRQAEPLSHLPPSSQPIGSSSDMLKYSSSMALSQVANEADAKDFTTGLTCTQSQSDDLNDKGLIRPLLASLLPSSQLESQPSQDLPGFKTPIGSEDNPLAGDDSIFNSSQGHSGRFNVE